MGDRGKTHNCKVCGRAFVGRRPGGWFYCRRGDCPTVSLGTGDNDFASLPHYKEKKAAHMRSWSKSYRRTDAGKASHRKTIKNWQKNTPRGRQTRRRQECRRKARVRAFRHFLKFLSTVEHHMSLIENAARPAITLEQARDAATRMSDEQLRKQFDDDFRMTKECLTRMGAGLVEMESRGMAVQGESSFLRLLRQIGEGRLLVDLVVRFAGRPVTLAGIRSLPVEEQEKLLNKSQQEVSERFRRMPKGKGHFSEVGAPGRLPTLANMGKSGTSQDVAEMCKELVGGANHPKEVAAILLPWLKELLGPEEPSRNGKPRKKAGAAA